MNEKWEKKMNHNQKTKELFLQYKEKENQIKDMLKAYGKMKEEGVSKEELASLREEIKKEQVKLLENFNQYKDFQAVKTMPKKEKVKTPIKLNTKETEGLKVIPIKRPKPRKKESINLMTMKKSEQGVKIIPLSRNELMERKVARSGKMAPKRTSRAEIIPIAKEKRKVASRNQQYSTKRKIKRVKKHLARKYRIAKARGKYRVNTRLRSFKRMVQKRVRAFQKVFKPSKLQDRNKRRIESPRQQRKERRLTVINLIDNTDGHIEANASEKIRKMPENSKQADKELNVIGW